MARPTKLTAAAEKVILDALRAGATRTAAFEAAGIARSKISVYLRRYGTFRDNVLQAEAQAELYMTVKLRQFVDSGSVKAVTFWLERRRPDDWGRHDRVELISSVRDLARREGWDAEEEALAVAEVESMLRAKRA